MQTGMKTEAYKLTLEYFEYFCQMSIKIDPYNFEIYRFKVDAFFETQCPFIIICNQNWNQLAKQP